MTSEDKWAENFVEALAAYDRGERDMAGIEFDVEWTGWGKEVMGRIVRIKDGCPRCSSSLVVLHSWGLLNCLDCGRMYR